MKKKYYSTLKDKNICYIYIIVYTYCLLWSYSPCVSISGSRAYLDVKELKEIFKLDGSTHLHIFFANSSDEDLAGVATWPWDKEALTHLGIEKTG